MDHMERTLKNISDIALDMRARWANYNAIVTPPQQQNEWANFMCAFANLMKEIATVANAIAMKTL